MDKSFPAVQTRVLQTGKAKWKEKGVEVSFPADWDCNKNSIVQNINKAGLGAACFHANSRQQRRKPKQCKCNQSVYNDQFIIDYIFSKKPFRILSNQKTNRWRN
jgi:hypothetical protein